MGLVTGVGHTREGRTAGPPSSVKTTGLPFALPIGDQEKEEVEISGIDTPMEVGGRWSWRGGGSSSKEHFSGSRFGSIAYTT